MKSFACAFAAVVLLAFPATGEERLVLPGVARANGIGGSRFVSTAWLHNPSDSPLSVDLALVAAAGPAGTSRVVLAPRQTLRLDDPVSTLFGLESAAGFLSARADRPFLLRGVTANVADPKGTYGLALPAHRELEALRPGETGTVPWLTHTAAAGTGFRTNVAVALLDPGTEVLVTGIEDPDSRAHSGNESIHLGELRRAMFAEALERNDRERRVCREGLGVHRDGNRQLIIG